MVHIKNPALPALGIADPAALLTAIGMPDGAVSLPYFLLMCPDVRRDAYQKVVQHCTHRVVFVDRLDALLTACVHAPPLAMMLDMVAISRAGWQIVAPLFELGMDWPVMRCSVLPTGEINALCMAPPQTGPLKQILEQIERTHAEGGKLPPPDRSRRDLRLNIQCRARMRVVGEPNWRLCNTLDMGAGGMFVATYDDLEPGTEIEIELHDLAEGPFLMWGTVVRRRTWDEGTLIPGVAVAFQEENVTVEFKHALSRSINTDKLV